MFDVEGESFFALQACIEGVQMVAIETVMALAFRVYVFITPVLELHLHVVTTNVLSSFKSRQRRSHVRNWCDDDWEARFSVRIRQGLRFDSPWRFLQVLSVRRSNELHDHRFCISHTIFTSGCMATGICFSFAPTSGFADQFHVDFTMT